MIVRISHVAGRFGLNPKEAERFLKFAVVGAIGFIVDFGVFNLTLRPFIYFLSDGFLTGWVNFFNTTAEASAALFAGTTSFVAAIISNFIWNRYWTYPDSRSKSFRRQFAQFVLVSVIGFVIRTPVLALATPPLTRLVASIPTLSGFDSVIIGSNGALIVAVVIVMFWNFFVNRYWTYSDVE